MSVKIDSFQCPICTEILENPVEFLNCGNNYCYKCFINVQNSAKKKNEDDKCPLCSNIPFSVKKNETLKNIISNMEYSCKICLKHFSYNEFIEHKLKCKLYLCKICNKKFFNDNILIKHFNDEKLHKDYIISVMNISKKKDLNELLKKVKQDLNIEKSIEESNIIIKSELSNISSIINHSQFNSNDESISIKKVELKPILTQEDVKKIRFLDLVSYKEGDLKNDITIIEYSYDLNILKSLSRGYKYYKKEDLIYCGKNNHIKCNCCKNHLCIPGNCMCFDCMNLNKKYHKINIKYLINKKGRVCKFDKCFNCNICYKIIHKDSDGNMYSRIKNCVNKNKICDDCKILNKIYGYYFDKDTIKNLFNINN